MQDLQHDQAVLVRVMFGFLTPAQRDLMDREALLEETRHQIEALRARSEEFRARGTNPCSAHKGGSYPQPDDFAQTPWSACDACGHALGAHVIPGSCGMCDLWRELIIHQNEGGHTA